MNYFPLMVSLLQPKRHKTQIVKYTASSGSALKVNDNFTTHLC
jgi:hypothetical protein